MSGSFSRTFHVRWGDMDFNGHMKNTAYLDVAGDVRMMYFQEHGFPMREFERLRLGPVILRDELEYFHELRLLEQITVSLVVPGLAEDASRFRIRNEFFTAGDRPVARVTSTGGWLDLGVRKLVAPPEALAALLRALPTTPDFEKLPSAIRGAS